MCVFTRHFQASPESRNSRKVHMGEKMLMNELRIDISGGADLRVTPVLTFNYSLVSFYKCIRR